LEVELAAEGGEVEVEGLLGAVVLEGGVAFDVEGLADGGELEAEL
jgi:hypothetical protein